MRTGAEYRDALRDGRRVWVVGEGLVEDMTTHPATCAMVEEYVAWYDRHFDPTWEDTLIAPPAPGREATAWAYLLPKTSEDLIGMGRSFAKTLFISAGNITHTPAYGHLISMGVLTAVEERNVSPKQIADASAYRELIARTGRFLTFCGGAAPIGFRLREDPATRTALTLVRETDAGVVISGRLGMHTSPAYAEDVYVGSLNGVEIDGHRASFIVRVGAPGVTTICRKIAARGGSRFVAPLSSRFDELDGQMWLENVFVPWERVFLVEPTPEPIATWLLWHHLYGWLAKAEFALGLALALADAMGLKEHEQTVEYLVDLVVEVQTVRSCLTAAERDPTFTVAGNCHANYIHLMPGGLAILKARQRISEILRIVPGSSLVVAPADSDLADPAMAAGLEDAFGGGGYSAKQRAALLQLAADHVSSALDGRESAFELHASGGVLAWRGRLRRLFPSYNELANAVLGAIQIPMPEIDVGVIPAAPLAPRRTNVAPPVPVKSGTP
ncbi:MAG TPA: 4-hydroxyphenylacetate 3-hydroxylase N-terminal domain-containing protein [Stellaceae bacterium]|nr:4-hydroxyphenylacetate 3-hydroxylase N-terminal domain-containing protein [Stellaceae bacterium]